MNWTEVSIATSHDGIDPVCAFLISMGIESMQIEDYEDFESFIDENRKYWDYVDEELYEKKRGVYAVKIYLPDIPSGRETLALLREQLPLLRSRVPDTNLGSLEISLGSVSEQDWETSWKQYYKPTEIGERLLIVPEWEPVPDTGRAVFLNNPGMSFGTGTHASTRLALIFLERCIREGHSVADLGCGSGILAICAVLLGAKRAVAVDIDQNAVNITRENAALNRVSDRIEAYCGDVMSDSALVSKIGHEHNLVLANIVADVIINITDTAKNSLLPGGLFISSGIIEDRLDEVAEQIRASGFKITEIEKSEGWASILAEKI